MKKWVIENYVRLIFGLTIILTSCFTFKLCPYNYKESSSFFYLFSTIAQTVGALLGIISAVLIFTVTSLDNKRDSLKPTLIDFIKVEKSKIIIPHLSLEKYIKDEGIDKIMKSNIDYSGIYMVFIDFVVLREYKEEIIKEFKFPIIISAFSIIYCIIGISLVEEILNTNIGLTLSLIAILLCIWTLKELTEYIIKLPNIATSFDGDN